MEASGVGGIKEVVAMVSEVSRFIQNSSMNTVPTGILTRLLWQKAKVVSILQLLQVLVMPEIEEVEYDIDQKTFGSTSHRIWCGWTERQQGRNSRSYRPLAISGEVQEERTQQNREKAMKIRARVATFAPDCLRRAGGSLRSYWWPSERIRTYNFPQNRVTDHRGLAWPFKTGYYLIW